MTDLSAAIVRNAADIRVPVDIEALLRWTYARQRADVVIGAGAGLYDAEAALDEVERHGSSACGCAAVERIQQLGVRVDGGGMASGALHEDAETVHRAVEALPRPLALLVMRHARAEDRPDWMPQAMPRAKPRLNGRGLPSVRYEPWDRNRNYGQCLVDWTVSMARIEAARLEYGLWRDALTLLAQTLERAGRLTRHRALPPAAPSHPWERARIG